MNMDEQCHELDLCPCFFQCFPIFFDWFPMFSHVLRRISRRFSPSPGPDPAVVEALGDRAADAVCFGTALAACGVGEKWQEAQAMVTVMGRYHDSL